MEGLMWRLARVPQQVLWELRRMARAFMRRFGLMGALIVACVALAIGSGWVKQRQSAALHDAQEQVLAERGRPALKAVPLSGADARTRLAEFDHYLLAYEDIPQALQDLLDLAHGEGLVVAKGEYRPEPDTQGRFLRYHMVLPVRGDAAAIRRFMSGVLDAQKTLALKSVQFKREQVSLREVEARIQWTLLTQLPRGGAAFVAPIGEPTARAAR